MELPDYDGSIGEMVNESDIDLEIINEVDWDDDEPEDGFNLNKPFKLILGPMIIPRSPWIEDQGWCIWLRDDPRSVTAMLHGKGDGREKLYERFSSYVRKKEPDISEPNLAHRYSEYAHYMDQKITADARTAAKNAPRIRTRSFLASRLGITFPSLGKQYAISVSTLVQLASVSGLVFWLYHWLGL